MAREIIRRVRADIPEYRWAMDGPHGRSIRESTEKALLTFVTQTFRTGQMTAESENFFRGLGRAEAGEGRPLDALLATFRVGSLVAWRRITAASDREPLPSDAVARLAELVFSFADRLAQLAGEGYASARTDDADGHERLRTRLTRMILNQPTMPAESIGELAGKIGWAVPDRVVVMDVVDRGSAGDRALALLGSHALVDREQATPIAVLPAPIDVNALSAAMRRTGMRAVAGCTVPLADAAKSLRWARLASRLCDDGVLPECELLLCDDHAPTLLVHAEPAVGELLVQRRLGALAAVPTARRLKFARLLSAWLEHGGSQAELAVAMGAHRQTVHYRIGRLQEMFGAQLADRDARIEIVLALRWALPIWEREAALVTP